MSPAPSPWKPGDVRSASIRRRSRKRRTEHREPVELHPVPELGPVRVVLVLQPPRWSRPTACRWESASSLMRTSVQAGGITIPRMRASVPGRRTGRRAVVVAEALAPSNPAEVSLRPTGGAMTGRDGLRRAACRRRVRATMNTVASRRRRSARRQNAPMADELDLDEPRPATAAAQTWARGAVSDVQPLTGGASSLTFTGLVTGGPTDGRALVLKVAPPGLEPVRNRDVARQARLMRRSRGARRPRADRLLRGRRRAARGVAVPRDEHRARRVPRADPHASARPTCCRSCPRGRSARRDARGAAPGDPDAVGLGGEKRYTLDDEIKRWTRAFETVDERMNAALPRSRGAALRHHAAGVARRGVPRRLPPRQHALRRHRGRGAHRLGDLVVVGPRLDLAWFLFFTDEAEHPMASNPGPTGCRPPRRCSTRTSRSRRGTGRPRVVPLPHPLQGGGRDRVLMKRLIKAGGDAGNATRRSPRSPSSASSG